ncbi:fibronectin type III domain-containing protein [bacterium]|nr:fibronectin type III domain-containing protein [bacterium]
MKTKLLVKIFISFLFWIIWFGSQGVSTVRGASQIMEPANDFLNISVGPRAIAMGEAFTGIADDVTSIFWNPAGLGQIKSTQMFFMYNLWFQDVICNYGVMSIPMSNSSLGLSILHINYGYQDKWDEFGNNNGSFEVYDMNIAAAYGIKFSDHFFLGTGIKVPFSTIDGKSQSSFAADLGLLFKIPGAESLQIGFNIKNFGTKVGEANQPTQAGLGLGFVNAILGLKIGLDINRHLFQDATQVNMGVEYSILGVLTPRLGYKISTRKNELDSNLVGLSAGFGFSPSFNGFALALDYAYVPYGDLGNTHQMAITLKWWQPVTDHSLMAIPGSRTINKFSPQKSSARRANYNKHNYKRQTYSKSKSAVSKRIRKTRRTLLPPTYVRLKKVGSRIRVFWKSSLSSQRYGYNVYMRKGKKGKYYRVNTKLLRKNSYTSKILKRKRSYYFIVKTVDRQSNKSRGTTAKKLYLK